MSSRTPARLSSDLLTRKGMAAPSAGPETRANMVGAPLAAETTRPQPRQGPALARSTLADWVAPQPASEHAPQHAPPGGLQGQHDRPARPRVRVSLRLDADRHARLKLVATQRACTLQSLFTEAIDAFFIRHAPDLHGISAQLRRATETTGRGGEIGRGKGNSEGRNGPSRSR